MTFGLDVIVTYDSTDDCIACRAQSVVMQALVPAAAAWEATAELASGFRRIARRSGTAGQHDRGWRLS